MIKECNIIFDINTSKGKQKTLKRKFCLLYLCKSQRQIFFCIPAYTYLTRVYSRLYLSHSREPGLIYRLFVIAKGPVTRCNFSCNYLSRNGVARQVAQVIAPFNMPCNGQNLCETSCMKHCTE